MTFEEWMQKNNYSLSGIDEQEAEFLMGEAWTTAWNQGLLHEADATDRLLQAADRDFTYMRKRIDFLEQRVKDLQGYDDLGYIDYKLAEAAHEAVKQNENL